MSVADCMVEDCAVYNRSQGFALSKKEQMSFRTVQEDFKREKTKKFRSADFLLFSSFSLLIPTLSKSENSCLLLRQKSIITQIKQQRKMRFTAIDTSAWEELKKSIVELTDSFNEYFAPPAELPGLAQWGRMPNTEHQQTNAQHYRDTSVLPFIQIGHKCYYKREDVEALLAKSNPHK